MTRSPEISSDHDAFPGDPVERRAAIELELKRIRHAASVARLEAREAELEAMLRQLDESLDDQTAPEALIEESSVRFESWQQVRDAQLAALPVSDATAAEVFGTDASPAATSALERAEAPQLRFDGAEITPRRPHFLHVDPEPNGRSEGQISDDMPMPASMEDFGEVEVVDDEENETPVRRRWVPASWLVSGIAHALLVIVLGWFTLTVASPKDQLALTGSPSEAVEEEIESISIETTEPEVEPTEPTSTEVKYDLSPVGEVFAAPFSPNPVEAPLASATSILRPSMSEAVSISKSTSTEKIEFCGIAGGGNHFVYLVDSSGSMGDAFASARLELLRSVSALRPDQRFYVVFFDEDPDYMRLSSPNVDEPASVMATPQNKEKLRRWAMRVQMNRGRAPYDPLEFALELKPDVIFLLSDGEFPERIVELLAEKNRVENLFGDVKPISIVHTIGYHSREGEARMRIIAKNNQGQYRYVPDPGEKR